MFEIEAYLGSNALGSKCGVRLASLSFSGRFNLVNDGLDFRVRVLFGVKTSWFAHCVNYYKD